MKFVSESSVLHDVRQWSAVPWRGLRLCVSAWVSVGRPSPVGRALTHRIRVMGGCVIWVRGTSHRYLTFLVANIHLAQQYRGNDHFLSAASSVRHVGGALVRVSPSHFLFSFFFSPLFFHSSTDTHHHRTYL